MQEIPVRFLGQEKNGWRRDRLPTPVFLCFPCGSAGKESACSAGDLGSSIHGLGRSPGEGKGFPLQYSGLEKSMDYIVHGVAKSWTRLNLKIHLDEQSEVNQLISDSSEKRESLYFIVLLRSSKDYFVVTRYKG